MRKTLTCGNECDTISPMRDRYNKSEKKQFRFIEDPGHGWLEVPMDIVDMVGATPLISKYSYRSDETGMAYLEEDCDYACFAVCAKRHGLEFSVDDYYEEVTMIRRMKSFKS